MARLTVNTMCAKLEGAACQYVAEEEVKVGALREVAIHSIIAMVPCAPIVDNYQMSSNHQSSIHQSITN